MDGNLNEKDELRTEEAEATVEVGTEGDVTTEEVVTETVSPEVIIPEVVIPEIIIPESVIPGEENEEDAEDDSVAEVSMESSMEDSSMEESSMEEMSMEENSKEEMVTEESVSQEMSADEAPIEEAPVEETTMEETAAQEVVVQEIPVSEPEPVYTETAPQVTPITSDYSYTANTTPQYVIQDDSSKDGVCLAGFILGIIGFFINPCYIVSILAIIFGAIGQSTRSVNAGKAKIGLILGICATVLQFILDLLISLFSFGAGGFTFCC